MVWGFAFYNLYSALTTGLLSASKGDYWISYQDNKTYWVISFILYLAFCIAGIVGIACLPKMLRKSKMTDQRIDQNFAKADLYDRPEFRSEQSPKSK
jgi:hypothetical protein